MNKHDPLTKTQRMLALAIGLTDLDLTVIDSVRKARHPGGFTALWVEPEGVRWFYGQEIRKVLRDNVEKA